MTITEALAEIKTIGKRIAKKREAIGQYLARAEGMKDPLDKDGGSVQFIEREMQAIRDLEERVIAIRAAIASANATTTISLNGDTRSISDWLVWRREVAPGRQQHLRQVQASIQQVRNQAAQRGVGLVNATASVQVGEVKPTDILVNVSEAKLTEDIDHLEDMLGTLDGQLSLKNATIDVQV